MNSKFAKAVGLSALRAFVAVFALGALDVYGAFTGDGDLNLSAGKAALAALATAAGAAAIRAVQAYFTELEPADREIGRSAARYSEDYL